MTTQPTTPGAETAPTQKRTTPADAIIRALRDEIATARVLEGLRSDGWVFAHKDDLAAAPVAPAQEGEVIGWVRKDRAVTWWQAEYPVHWEPNEGYPIMAALSPPPSDHVGMRERVALPVEPPPGLLMSMAIRYDHGLGCPGYYDQSFFGAEKISHEKRLESALTTMRQLYDEVAGYGFYSPDKEAECAGQAKAALKETGR